MIVGFSGPAEVAAKSMASRRETMGMPKKSARAVATLCFFAAMGAGVTHVIPPIHGMSGNVTGDCFPFAEKSDLKSRSFAGYANITLSKTQFAPSEQLEIQFTFFNRAGGDWFYNIFFNRLKPLPGALVIYDSGHKCIGNLIARGPGSQVTINRQDWSWIQGEGHAGLTFSWLKAGYVPPPSDFLGNSLPSGTYYLQMVLYKSFIQGPRAADHPESFYAEFDRTELLRSNVVKIEIKL